MLMSKQNAWLDKDVSWEWETNVNADSIIEELGIVKKDNVLDVGCGPGTYLNDIQKKTGAKSFGCDIRTDVFAANKNKKVKLIEGDMLKLPYRAGFFDKLFSLGVLEHDPDHDRVFGEAARVLKKGGKILLTVPNLFSFFHVTKHVKMLLGRWDVGYEASFTIPGLKRLLQKQGLVVEKAYMTPHPEVRNVFNWMDNKMHGFNGERFGFFVRVVARKV